MIKIGTLVQDQYGNIGRVTKFYDDFSAISASCLTMTGDEWLERQNIPFKSDHLTEMWCRVTIRTGGSCWSPLSCLAILEEDGYHSSI